MDSLYSDSVFPIYEYDLDRIPGWQQTPEDSAIRRIVTLARARGLDVELHLELWITEDFKRNNPDLAVFRGTIQPSNVDLWFKSLQEWAIYYACLAEELDVEYFCPFDEFDSMERYTAHVEALLEAVSQVFSGELVVAGAIHKYVFGWYPIGATPGEFWDYPGLHRGENCWTLPLDDNKDQKYSEMVESFYSFWESIVAEHHEEYPGHSFLLSAVGFYNWDGQVLGFNPNPSDSTQRDDQEMSDSWAATLVAASALGIDGIAIWDYNLSHRLVEAGSTIINESPIIRVIKALLMHGQ